MGRPRTSGSSRPRRPHRPRHHSGADEPTTGRAGALLAWYRKHRRDLPWRAVQDPYAIWVSEIMLQQTRVDTVVPYYLRWMERFPTTRDLADADEEDVLRHWAGLGYYSRARNLHRAAVEVESALDGRVPTAAAALRRLPGIGPYTAGAIASIAFGEAVPAVDGNVLRVLARWTMEDGDLRDPATRRRLSAHAARLVVEDTPGDWNQALMELGATVCTPTTPACDRCPVATWCRAFTEGDPAAYPVVSKRRAPTEEPMHFAWIEADGAVLLVRAQTRLLGGLWGLPGGSAAKPLADLVMEQAGLEVVPGERLGETSHRFTHRHWCMRVHEAGTAAGAGAGAGAVRTGEALWVPVDELDRVAASTAHRKAFAVALASRRLRVPVGADATN